MSKKTSNQGKPSNGLNTKVGKGETKYVHPKAGLQTLDHREKNQNIRKRQGIKEAFTTSVLPVVKEGINDISWYAQNPQILADSSSLAFATPLGGKFNVGDAYLNSSDNVSIPGICALRIVPAVGISTDNYSPINIAARNLYSFVRHANSGHANYNSPDEMLYLMAMDNLYSFHAWMTRIYGVMRFYIPTNRYLAKTLVESMGAQFDSLESAMSDFRFYINTFAIKVSSLCTPASMAYFSRHRWIYSNVYLDEPNVKAQSYIFTPEHFLQFEEMTGEQTFGVLKLTPKITNMSYTAIRTLGNNMVAKIIESEDMNIMSGDILKAFGEGNVLRVPTIDENHEVVPVYNPEVLTQIHNTRILGALYYEDITDPFVTQDPDNGAIVFNPQFRGYRGNRTDLLFDLPSDNPTPADVMVASRLSVISKNEVMTPANHNEVTYNIDSCGSDVCVGATIYTFATNVSGFWIAEATECEGVLLFGDDQGMLMTNVDLISKWHHFEQHPRLLMISDYDEALEESSYLGGFSDTTNFTVVNADDLKKMHECALLSMFDVPGNGMIKG